MLTTVAEANSAIGRQPGLLQALQRELQADRDEREDQEPGAQVVDGRDRRPCRRRTHCRYSVPMIDAAMKPSTNFGNRSQNWPSVGRALLVGLRALDLQREVGGQRDRDDADQRVLGGLDDGRDLQRVLAGDRTRRRRPPRWCRCCRRSTRRRPRRTGRTRRPARAAGRSTAARTRSPATRRRRVVPSSPAPRRPPRWPR